VDINLLNHTLFIQRLRNIFFFMWIMAASVGEATQLVIDADSLDSQRAAGPMVRVAIDGKLEKNQPNKSNGYRVTIGIPFEADDLIRIAEISTDLQGIDGLRFAEMRFAFTRAQRSEAFTAYVAPARWPATDAARIRTVYGQEPKDLSDEDLQKYFQEALHLAKPRLTANRKPISGYDAQTYFSLLRIYSQLSERMNLTPPDVVSAVSLRLRDAISRDDDALTSALPSRSEAGRAVDLAEACEAVLFKRLADWLKRLPCAEQIQYWEKFVNKIDDIPDVRRRRFVLDNSGITRSAAILERSRCVREEHVKGNEYLTEKSQEAVEHQIKLLENYLALETKPDTRHRMQMDKDFFSTVLRERKPTQQPSLTPE
jgi:hypothetical protein